MAGGVFASRAIPRLRPPVVEEELGGPMMVGGAAPLSHRDSNPSSRSRDRESMVRFAGDEEEEGGNRQTVMSEEREEPMDPFEDQRGGYYGYEDERGFGAQRGSCEFSTFRPISSPNQKLILFALRQSFVSNLFSLQTCTLHSYPTCILDYYLTLTYLTTSNIIS